MTLPGKDSSSLSTCSRSCSRRNRNSHNWCLRLPCFPCLPAKAAQLPPIRPSGHALFPLHSFSFFCLPKSAPFFGLKTHCAFPFTAQTSSFCRLRQKGTLPPNAEARFLLISYHNKFSSQPISPIRQKTDSSKTNENYLIYK